MRGNALGQEQARYQRNPNFVFRRIVDEAVLVPIHGDVADMECIYTLSDVGAFVWSRMETAATTHELQAAVLEEYSAEPAAVASDLEAFLREMLSIGAVHEV